MRTLLLLVAACGAPRQGPETRSDAAAYSAALAAGDPTQCARVEDPRLRSDCYAWIARQQAVEGDTGAAVATCEALQPGTAMRGECFFLVADAVGARSDQARALCAQAAPYDQRCLEHAVRRELAAVLGELPRGDEARVEAEAEAERVASEWVGRQRGRRFARHVLSKRIAERPDATFSAETCGTISAPVCSRAFELRIDAWMRAQADAGPAKAILDPLCPPPVAQARAASSGAPTWAPDAAEPAAAAWRRACAKAADPRSRPTERGPG